MAKYLLVASILHPCEEAWTKERYPFTWESYKLITDYINNNEPEKAKKLMLDAFATESDNIETHDWEDELVLDTDGAGYWLFKRII